MIPCTAVSESQRESRVVWERTDSELPTNYYLHGTDMIIPKIQKVDAGKYKCTVESLTGRGSISTVELKVGGNQSHHPRLI